MSRTSIEWVRSTDGTQGHSINPLRARLNGNVGHYCEKTSPGCKNCYSSRLQPRFRMPQFQEQRRQDVETFLDASKLAEVLKRRKPTTYFWCDMTDLFGEWVPNEVIAACFGVMAATPWHTHQVLTKRAARLPEWFEWYEGNSRAGASPYAAILEALHVVPAFAGWHLGAERVKRVVDEGLWPLPNCWLGVSAEDQQRADERIPDLLATPAAVRFVSAEPLVGPIDFTKVSWWQANYLLNSIPSDAPEEPERINSLTGSMWDGEDMFRNEYKDEYPPISWIIAGGESGPGARPCDIEWIRSIVKQCRDAGVPAFVKQLGGRVFAPWKLEWRKRMNGSLDLFSSDRVGVKGTNLATVWANGTWHTWDADGTGGENDSEESVEKAKQEAVTALSRQHVYPIKGWARHAHMLRHRKGGDPAEWPTDLRVRQIPHTGVSNA